ncbi:MAG: MATE family efflux transporter [Eubacterium sp.]|nr:MATE family efflux transporter [Eubacterium sp.]
MNRNSIDMTHGPLAGKLIMFAIPLIAANILQLLFNAADVIVVGRFAGSDSLAAVGSTTSAIFLFINVMMGLSVGVNVMIARFLGITGEDRKISRTVHTAVSVGILGGIGVGLVGIALAGPLLRLMAVPEEIFPLAVLYMRIYFAGTAFNMVYNYGAAALRARGDTKRPLYYLTISGLLNVILNLLFVIVLKMNVAGVALATIISQGVSAVLVLINLSKSDDALRFSFRNLCIDGKLLADMARIGVPAGLQMCLFSIANMTVQGAINSYGGTVMAGVSAATSIESFMYTAMAALHQTCQTFTSQNAGARKYDRVDRVVRLCLLYALIVGVVLSLVIDGFRYPLLHIYNTDPAVVEAGVVRMVIMVTPYFIYGMADVFVGAIRGCGHALSPVIATLLCTCLLRILWTLWLDTSRYGVEWIYYSFPVTWLLLLIVVFIIWRHVRKQEGAAEGISG